MKIEEKIMQITFNPAITNKSQSTQKAKSPAFGAALNSTAAFKLRDRVAFEIAEKGKEAASKLYRDQVVTAYRDQSSTKHVKAYIVNIIEMLGLDPQVVLAEVR